MSRLKEIRENRGFSQGDLARKTGIMQATISKYESGYCKISEENMIKLIKALETNADYFLGLIDHEEEKETK